MTVGGYYQSWSAPWVSVGAMLDLANVPIGIEIVYISFGTPNCTYVKGSKKFGGTGMQFSMDFDVVKNAIAMLKARQVTVMISVGGASYPFGYNFNSDKAKCLWALCEDLDCDGIDIDWEASTGIAEEKVFASIISNFQIYKPLTRKFYLSAACFSVGAYPATSANPNCGMNIYGLQQGGSCLDWINIMAYDAGGPEMYDVSEAYKAYRSYYKGTIYIGVQIGTQAWGGDLLTIPKLKKALQVSGGNIFIWSLGKSSAGTPSVAEILKESALTVLPINVPPVAVANPIGVTTSSLVDCPQCKSKLNLQLTYTAK